MLLLESKGARGPAPLVVAVTAALVGLVSCGEETFDLLPAQSSMDTGGYGLGGAEATGGSATGGAPTGGAQTLELGGADVGTGGNEPDSHLIPCGYCADGVPCAYCTEGEFCDTSRYPPTCVPFRCDQEEDCRDERRSYCVDGYCVGCRDDDDCPIPAPFCVSPRPNDRWCVQCRQDADCSNPYEPVCAVDIGRCVECTDSSLHCAEPTPLCDTWKFRCVQCIDPVQDCAEPTPLCHLGMGQCVECFDPARDCLPGQYCDPTTWRCLPPVE